MCAGLERLARPQLQARRVAGDGAGDRLLLLVGRQRHDVADPDLVGEDRAGRQHLHAGDDDAVIVLAHHAQGRHRHVLPLIELGIARGLRRHHGIARIDVVVADVAVIGDRRCPHGRTGAFKLVGLHRHAGDEGRDVVGRAAEHAIGDVGDAPWPIMRRRRSSRDRARRK